MKLVVFDIDGTLLDTNKVDGDCFVRAFQEEFSINNIETDWNQYDHPTDSGITQTIFLKRFSRLPADEEIRRVKTRFVSLLQECFNSNPNSFREIPGARNIISSLPRNADWKVAIATGCWHESAIFKLTCGGISVDGIPLSTSDLGVNRDSIFKSCIEKARDCYGVGHFTKTVAIGDRTWDVETARKLRLGFIGIGNRRELSQVGANQVLEDYPEPDQFVQLLELATIPVNSAFVPVSETASIN